MTPPIRPSWPDRILGFLFFVWGFGVAGPLSGLVCIAGMMVAPIGGIPAVQRAARGWTVILRWVTGVTSELDAEAPLPPSPCVFVFNHQGLHDIVPMYAHSDRWLVFPGKKGLFQVPLVGAFMRRCGYVPIDRQNHANALESMRLLSAALREGRDVGVFAEGTRSPDGRIHAFKKGPFVLAIDAQVPIVPVAVDGPSRIWPKGTAILRPGHIRMRFGRAIPTAGLSIDDRDSLRDRTRAALIALHRSIGGVGGVES